MSERHEVTVYDRVPSTARVSVEQVERYLIRTGWSARWADDTRGLCHWKWGGERLWTTREPHRMAETVSELARAEQRQPSAVLADIAKEEA